MKHPTHTNFPRGDRPSCVILHPDNEGIILEWRTTLPDGKPLVCEMTLFYSGVIELTVYHDGKVVLMT